MVFAQREATFEILVRTLWRSATWLISCMRQQSPSPGHPGMDDEAKTHPAPWEGGVFA